MPEDLSGTYEVIVPITRDAAEGPIPAGNTVELSHEDAEAFLARDFIRAPEGSGQGEPEPEDPGFDPLDQATVNALFDGGYGSADAVRSATDEELLAIEAIGEGRLAKIRAVLPREEA